MDRSQAPDLLEAGLEDGERETEEGKAPQPRLCQNQSLLLHLGKTPGRKEEATLGARSVLGHPSFLCPP